MALTFDQFMDRLKASTGADEDATLTLGGSGGFWNRLRRKEVTHRVSLRQAANKPYEAQTASLSLTQPLTEQTVYVAPNACTLVKAYITPDVSLTISASDYQTFIVQGRKSATYSATFGLASLASTTTTAFTPNLARAAVPMVLESTTVANLNLAAGETVNIKTTKTLLGSRTPPFTLTLVFEEN